MAIFNAERFEFVILKRCPRREVGFFQLRFHIAKFNYVFVVTYISMHLKYKMQHHRELKIFNGPEVPENTEKQCLISCHKLNS